VSKAQSDIGKAFEEIAAKEDAVEARRARHTLETAMEKLERSEKQCKGLEGKLQQLEAQTQKAERQQQRRNMELVGEIEERVKREFRKYEGPIRVGTNGVNGNGVNGNGVNGSGVNTTNAVNAVNAANAVNRTNNSNNNNNPNNNNNNPNPSNRNSLVNTPTNEASNSTVAVGSNGEAADAKEMEAVNVYRGSERSSKVYEPSMNGRFEDDDVFGMLRKGDSPTFARMNERLNAFENRLGAVEDSVEDLADGKRKAQKMQSDEALKERINELKP
jgi:archaellum component FlaC